MSDQKTFNLDNIDFSDLKQRINSPKSIEACRRSGINPNDLYKIDFETFLNNFPEIRILDKDLQIIRYQNYEKIRLENIKIVQSERSNIPNIFNINSLGNSRSIDFNKLLGKTKQSSSSDRSLIEKVKQRQKQEVQSKIEQELKLEMIRRENEDKAKQKKILNEMRKKALMERTLHQIEEAKKKEAYRIMMQNIQNENTQKQLEFKLQQEQRKKEMIIERQKNQKIENIIKNEQKNQKILENKLKNESILAIQQQRTLEKQELADNLVKWKREMELRKINQKKLEAEYNEIQAQNRILEIKNKTEQEIEYKRKQNELKYQQNEEKKRYFENLKKAAIKNQMESSQLVEKTLQTDPSKLIEILHKSSDGQGFLQLDKNSQVKARRFVEQQQKSKSILSKFEEMERRLQMKKQYEERQMMLKYEQTNLKNDEKEALKRRKANINEYNREKSLDRIREKYQKIEEFKRYKEEIFNSKRIASEQINQRKKEIIEKIEKITKNSNNIDPQEIQKLFPGENELIQKLMVLKAASKSPKRADSAF